MTLCIQTSTRSHLVLIASALLTVFGCAGSNGPPPQTQVAAASVGDEPEPESESEPEPAPVAKSVSAAAESDDQMGAAAPTTKAALGRGHIVVSAKVNGQPVTAHVKVLEGATGVEGSTGEPISLPAGNQRISVTIADTQSLLDKPTQKLSVFVEAGKPTAVDVTFRWAKVRLDVLVGGRSQGSVPVKLFRNGEVVAEIKSGVAPQAISPGKYEADVLLRGRTIRVTGLVFLEGAEQTVPVRAQL